MTALSSYRYIFSVLLAAIITMALFFLMIVLIKVKRLQPTETYLMHNLAITSPVVIEEDIIEELEKPTIKVVEYPPSSKVTLEDNKKIKYPSDPINIKVPKPEIKIDLAITKNNFGKYISANNSGPSETYGPSNGEFGFVTDSEGSLTSCTIGFNYNTRDGLTNFQWYNCNAEIVTDLSEKKLYSWIQENPNQLAKYQQNHNDEILVTFSSNSLY